MLINTLCIEYAVIYNIYSYIYIPFLTNFLMIIYLNIHFHSYKIQRYSTPNFLLEVINKHHIHCLFLLQGL